MIALALTSGCATRGSVRRAEARTAGLEEALGEIRRGEERLAREVARLSSEVQAFEAGIREAHAAAREAASQTAALRTRLDPGPATRSDAPGTAPGAPAGGTPPGPDVEARAHTADPERAYAAALATWEAREHGQAVLDFLDFIARYPTHRLAASAQHWIGEAYYAQRDYRQALAEFEKTLERPAPNASAPESLWKIGLCHAHLGSAARARDAWQRLVREYPGSEAARRARATLTARGARVTP